MTSLCGRGAIDAMHYRVLLSVLTLGVALLPFACHPTPSVETPKPDLVLQPAQVKPTWERAQRVLENRCVVCHGCYDAPCQLKLGTWEGIERGGTDKLVYDGARLVATDPTRLGIDAKDKSEWRFKGFHAVLPEGKNADPRAGVLVRMLELKKQHPLTEATDIAKDFTLDLNRTQTCTDDSGFAKFEKDHPMWGMPYALPGIAAEDEAMITDWVRAGAPHVDPPALPASIQGQIDAWEQFFNDPSPKGQLVARYIYEHLFLASIRFGDGTPNPPLFRLLRSKSEPGSAVVEVTTRRPFDDPGVPRVYYRFDRRLDRPLDKTLMPYRLDTARLEHWKQLFYGTPWDVKSPPGYKPDVAANPFRAFADIPMPARYRFMLEESEFIIQGFIKGPVCRGQVALNVIEDRFWVTFVDPDAPWQKDEAAFLANEKLNLDLPAEAGSNAWPTLWFKYGQGHMRYVTKKAALTSKEPITIQSIWNGDGSNTNAALTVFRHFDSATVVRGLVGGIPKTAWVMDYPLLERIHYLLVAGYDVYGNVGHQITTRLYMDYLRMEGEADFLALLPPVMRQQKIDYWYRGVTGQAKAEVDRELQSAGPGLTYKTKTPEVEVFEQLEARIGPALVKKRAIDQGSPLAKLETRNPAAQFMPESAFVVVDGKEFFTLSRETGHTNVAHLFFEDKRLLPDEDSITVSDGFLGAYPNAIFAVKKADLPAFATAVSKLDSVGAYHDLRKQYGVLRTSDRFWHISDTMNDAHGAAGLFDYNRLEAY